LPRQARDKHKATLKQEAVSAGTGITLNTLYANPYLWGFQYPIVCELRKKGTPIESLTIGAGVPTAEKAVEICDGLLEAGIQYMAFKPGSLDAVQEVIDIAKANPKMTVMLQVRRHKTFELLELLPRTR
jgi:enoyl reductase-like protein